MHFVVRFVPAHGLRVHRFFHRRVHGLCDFVQVCQVAAVDFLPCHVTGRRIRKRGGNPALFEYALKQLNEDPKNVIAFGNEMCDAQAAANAGIKAYHCIWGAKAEEREQMLTDPEHQCITSPLQIIDILRSEVNPQSQAA